MSIDDLKQRLADVPGIETLTMQTLVGRQVFGFNGLIAGVDLHATDQDIEDAIRSAAHTHTSFRSSPGAGTGSLPAGEIEPSVMLAYAPGESIPTPLPAVNLTEPNAMTDTPSPTGFVPGEISSLFKSLRARKDAMVADIMANGAEVANILTAGEAMAASLKAEGEALKAEFAQLTNGAPK